MSHNKPEITKSHLQQVEELFKTCEEAFWNKLQEDHIIAEWEQYMTCDGLPAPWDVPAMNSYLHFWKLEIPRITISQCIQRTKEVITLLDKLENTMSNPFDKRKSKLKDWQWIRENFKARQAESLNTCTYRLLKDIKTQLNRVSIPTAEYRLKEELFAICLYATLAMPIPVHNPRTQPKPRLKLDWSELGMEIVFPQALKCDMIVVRGLYVVYDHLTETSETFDLSVLPEYYNLSMKEVYKQFIYKYSDKNINIETKEKPEEPEVFDFDINNLEGEEKPSKTLKNAKSDLCQERMLQEMTSAREFLLWKNLSPGTLNLRKFSILGGIYFLDLFQQPHQPQSLVSYELTLSTVVKPPNLEHVKFLVNYQSPPAHPPGTRRTPEQIEAEMMQQEKELDQLILITLQLPKHVFWLEPPLAIQWNSIYKNWTTSKIYDYKYIEEKGYVTFRTTVFRPIAIGVLRWCNLPYQAWESRPEKDGSVTFQLTCAILTLEFHVQGHLISVKDIQCAPNNAFDLHIGVYYQYTILKKIMKNIGIDVFPDFDTFSFVEGTCEKFWPMEHHLYFIMAYISVVYNMSWSRWNIAQDFRNIVFQMRNYRFDRSKQPNFQTVLIRPDETAYIDCTEVSAEFSDSISQGSSAYVDLWHLIRSTSTKSFKSKIENVDLTMVKTLYRLFKDLRFLSFS